MNVHPRASTCLLVIVNIDSNVGSRGLAVMIGIHTFYFHTFILTFMSKPIHAYSH